MDKRWKLTLMGIALALATLACARGATAANDDELLWGSLQWDGVERNYALYVPSTLPEAGGALVVYLHGGEGSVAGVWKHDTTQSFRQLADEHGFILLMPEGRADPTRADSHHWNDCRGDIDNENTDSHLDDVGLVRALVEQTLAGYPLNPARVYVSGASNGGMMTYRLLQEAPDLFAAGAAMIANLPAVSDCAPQAVPVPVLILNGTADPLMPFMGGCVANKRCHSGTVLSSDETLAYWLATNGADADAAPQISVLPDNQPRDGSTITGTLYPDAQIAYYVMDGAGHIPPGPARQPGLSRWLLGSRNRDVDAAALIWAFFAEVGVR